MTKTFSFIFSIIALSFSISACVSAYHNPNLPNLTPESDYLKSLEDYTVKKQIYDGLYQTMEFTATMLNTKVTRLQVDQSARIYQWTESEYQNKKSAAETSLSKQTEIFMGFFVPERKHDDLHKSTTLWKIFLDVNGKRYEGKATKIKTILADITSLYPHHTRFNTPYKITFAVPASMVENAVSKLTLTGPVGSTFVEFQALK